MEALQKNKESVSEKKIQVVGGARLHDTSQIAKATLVQDRIRHKVGKWKGARVIHQWRSQAQ